MDRGSGRSGQPGSADRREGTGTLADTTVMAVFSSPYIAAVLGVGVGVGSLAVARAASRLVTPDDAFLGFAKVALISFARMLVILAALAAVFFFARPGFVAFGVALIVSFIGTLGYEAFRVSTRHRPARTS